MQYGCCAAVLHDQETPMQDPINRNILRDSQGRYVFFPWGGLSCGYILPDHHAGDRLGRTLRIFGYIWLVAAMAAFLLGMQFGDWPAAAALAFSFMVIYVVTYTLLTRRFTRNLPLHPGKFDDVMREENM